MRDGVVTLMEAWVSVSAPDRVIPVLADYLGTSRGAGAEGKARPLRLCPNNLMHAVTQGPEP